MSGASALPSRTDAVVSYIAEVVAEAGHTVSILAVRDLPAGPLLRGEAQAPGIHEAVARLVAADALVIATPIYKAAYSGVLKVFLDLLPQYALAGKTVLPVATGGSLAHVLTVDYALRPVLTSLGADHVTQGWFVHSAQIADPPTGAVSVGQDARSALAPILAGFVRAISVAAS